MSNSEHNVTSTFKKIVSDSVVQSNATLIYVHGQQLVLECTT